jgi:peptidoglycan hydrolase-like protein with peptidoglycan-binding domain
VAKTMSGQDEEFYDVPRKEEIPEYPGDVMEGGKGAAVGTWMYALRRRGYDLGDAVFGDGTLKQVRAWQQSHRPHLTVDGVFGKNTWNSLWNDPAPPGPPKFFRPPAFRKVVKKGMKGVAVGDCYFVLRYRGAPIVDAVFGPATKHIIVDWQSKHGLPATGVGNQKTWHSLWFGK